MNFEKILQKHYWYYSAVKNMSDFATTTSTVFGQGEQNTINMTTKWNSNAYGSQNGGSSGYQPDMWGLSAVNSRTWNNSSGWYVPSRDEWAVFAGELNITNSNYRDCGLAGWNWSSSQTDRSSAWCTNLPANNFLNDVVGNWSSVRLGMTF